MDFAPLPQHLTGIALDDAGDNFHERGFTRAIFAEQQVDLAGLNGQFAIPQRSDAAVPFFDVVEFEEHRKRTSLQRFRFVTRFLAAGERQANAPQAKPGRPPAKKKGSN